MAEGRNPENGPQEAGPAEPCGTRRAPWVTQLVWRMPRHRSTPISEGSGHRRQNRLPLGVAADTPGSQDRAGPLDDPFLYPQRQIWSLRHVQSGGLTGPDPHPDPAGPSRRPGTGRLSPPASPPESALRPSGPSTGCGRFTLFLPSLVPPSRDLRETRHPLWLSILPSLRRAKTFHGAVGPKVGIHAIVIRHGGRFAGCRNKMARAARKCPSGRVNISQGFKLHRELENGNCF